MGSLYGEVGALTSSHVFDYILNTYLDIKQMIA